MDQEDRDRHLSQISTIWADVLQAHSGQAEAGARPSTAWQRIYEGRKALWALSHCGPVDYALDKRYFADQGLLSLEHRYREMHRVIAPAQLTLALE